MESKVSLEINMEKFEKIRKLSDNWNGYGASAFAEKDIDYFTDVIRGLEAQPTVVPTGRRTIYSEYRVGDKQLGLEINKGQVDWVYVVGNNFDAAKTGSINEETSSEIANSINCLYKQFLVKQ